MGCCRGDRECEDDERPAHEVRITTSFQIGKYEVTQEQWERVMGKNPSAFIGLDRPVERVSWNAVQEFLKKLNELNDGYLYSLPTEAEWEYAARAGQSGWKFVWGNESLPVVNGRNQANVADETVRSRHPDWKIFETYHDGYEGTAPVGSFAPNGYGLHDMVGNVMEWCDDWYDKNYYRKSPPADPRGPASAVYRVVRGGSWSGLPNNARISNRNGLSSFGSSYNIGFRCVRRLPRP